MDPLKEAFSKIKNDINYLKEELKELKEEIISLKSLSNTSTNQVDNSFISNGPTDKQTNNPTDSSKNMALEEPYTSNNPISIGNRGVPTDKQTNRQTDNSNTKEENSSHNPSNNNIFTKKSEKLSEISNVLESLDSLKREIRLKFKRLTPQETLIFSTLYQLEEVLDYVTYKSLSEKTNLSESSIRDYINRLISKGIPIEKTRQNNKTITLKVSKDLKKVATLDTILSLRSL